MNELTSNPCQLPVKMKPSTIKVWHALRQGHQLTQGNGRQICSTSAITQRCNELRRDFHKDIRDRWETASNGARYKVYFLPPALCDMKPEPRTEIHVQAHVRRVPELVGYESEEQCNLFS